MDTKLNVAIYCRLSREDGDSIESSSIKTQKDILTEYANTNNWNIYKYYVDDGYSGGNFNRPAFKELIEDIEDRKINIIITKDLSRLGRNYIESGYYTEEYFPSKNVRYIAVNDNYDSLKEDNDLTPFKNIINQWYLKDLSKKIKSSNINRMKKGILPKGRIPLFGYLHDENNNRIINEETAPTVRKIYELYNNGYTLTKIARILTQNKMVTPSYYMYIKFGAILKNITQNEELDKYAWTDIMIQRILREYQYTGSLVLGKTTSKSYKTHQKKFLPKEQHFIFEDKYPPIISKETYYEAERIRKTRTKSKVPSEVDKYHNMIICPNCRKSMSYVKKTKTKKNNEREIYRCCKKDCHYGAELRVEIIDILINYEINNLISKCLQHQEEIKKYSYQYVTKKNKQNNYETIQTQALKERNKKLDLLIEKLFERSITNEIPKETYTRMMTSYKKEYEENKKQINIIEDSIKRKSTIDYISLTNSFLNYLNQIKSRPLTSEILRNIIESITIQRTFPRSKEYIVKIRYKKIPDLLEDYFNEENQQ